jgi:hypothetical protein
LTRRLSGFGILVCGVCGILTRLLKNGFRGHRIHIVLGEVGRFRRHIHQNLAAGHMPLPGVLREAEWMKDRKIGSSRRYRRLMVVVFEVGRTKTGRTIGVAS